MKIGIITFHASFNYGSMLQAYALQTFLEREGHDVEIINFRTAKQKSMYPKPIRFNNYGNVKQNIKRLLFEPNTILPLLKKWSLFDKFLHNRLKITKEYSTVEELIQANFKYDLLITGSDQIWNTDCGDFSEAYFGNFINSTIPKIAYAVSMGPHPETKDPEFYKSEVMNFKAISVREQRTKSFLENNGICDNAQVVLDPTMLLEKEDYLNIINPKPLINKDYVFYYTPFGPNHKVLKEAATIAKEKGLPIICDNSYYVNALKEYSNVIPYPAVGPEQFLNLIMNAKAVCGESFHLMIFSIIFGKEFYCINGDVDSRIQNLAKIAGFEDRMWSLRNKEKNYIHPYKKSLSNKLEVARTDSMRFLLNNIEGD